MTQPTLPRTMAVEPGRDDAARQRAAVRRTGLLLLAIALLFFFGVIASRFIESPVVSIAVVGGAILLYLLVAIGRHLWK
jgi:small neutral amino acid transporter SnatA (MarC family)